MARQKSRGSPGEVGVLRRTPTPPRPHAGPDAAPAPHPIDCSERQLSAPTNITEVTENFIICKEFTLANHQEAQTILLWPFYGQRENG